MLIQLVYYLASKLWFVCLSAMFTLLLHAWSIWSSKWCVIKYLSNWMCFGLASVIAELMHALVPFRFNFSIWEL